MDIIEFEKAYAELIARGIDPSEFGRWLISFDERHPYAPAVSPLRPLPEFVYVYEGFEDKRFYRDVELSGIRIADGLTLRTNMQLCGCDALCAAEYARECGELLPAYDELMLTVSLLPKLNAVLQAGGLSPVPVTRPFWCRQGDSFELIGLCNGKPWRESPGNGGVLLKFP